MLGAILKKEACAECRFCCAFRKTSLWEVPVFTRENTEAIKKNQNLDSSVLVPLDKRLFGNTETDIADYLSDYSVYDLTDCYQTDDPEEEVPCPYLGRNGCVLSAEEKPWDCKIWPLRVMRTEGGEVVIALTPTCPEINKINLNDVKKFVNENLRDELLSYAKSHPYLIKEYREDFPIL